MSASNLAYDVVSILAKSGVSIATLFAALLCLLGVLDGLYQLTLCLRTESFDAEAQYSLFVSHRLSRFAYLSPQCPLPSSGTLPEKWNT